MSQLARITILQRNRAFRALGITGTQHSYILNVCRSPGITQDALARRIYVNKSNVARQVAQLEASGLLRREASAADRRAIRLYPTAQAEAIYPEIIKALDSWNQFLLAELTELEKETLTGLMSRVVKRAADTVGEEEVDG